MDTLLIVSSRRGFRQRFRLVFEEEYNILECGNKERALLMMEQNASNNVVVLADCTAENNEAPEKVYGLCERSRRIQIPVIIVLSSGNADMECAVLEAGAADVIARKDSDELIRCRVRNVMQQYRMLRKIQEKNKEQKEMLLYANEKMLDALSSLIEYRSVETNLHVLRIRQFTRILLEEVARTCPEYALTEQMIAEITSAAALHDVGKIGIPDSILNKPGSLTPEEREVIKSHSIIGAQIIERLEGVMDPSYLRYAYNICKYHHERWDGRGYPRGISGDDIPICAQVVGLTDVYDALTNKRVYKDAYGVENAVQMILNGECGLFSPRLLECFKSVRKKFYELSRYYSDDQAVRTDAGMEMEIPSPVYQAEISSLHRAQNKYKLLLNYVNSTVVELDPKYQNYHVVHNPSASLALLNTGSSFRQSIENLLTHYAREEEREEVAGRIFHHMRQHSELGLKQSKFGVSFGGGEKLRRYTYEITLMSLNRTEEEAQTTLMIWNKTEGDLPSGQKVFTEDEKRLFDEVECRAIVGTDYWLTLEDNRAAAKMLHYPPEQFKARFENRLIHALAADKPQEYADEIQMQLAQNTEVEIILPMRCAEGETADVLLKGKQFVDQNGFGRMAAVLTRLDTAYEEARDNRKRIERYNAIFASYEQAVFEWNLLSDELVYHRNWEKIFGYDPSGMKVSMLLQQSIHIHPDDLEKIQQTIRREDDDRKNLTIDARILGENGRYNWYRFVAAIEYGEARRPKSVSGIISNVDKEKRSEQELLRKTEVDTLTRLLNKDAARKYVEECLSNQAKDEQSALLIIDLDNFKSVNDRYGHMFGDVVLCETAMVIRRHFRPNDIVARIGGDEFMVMMNPNVSRDLIDRRCSALCKALKEHLEKLVHEGSCSCSIGVAFAPEAANNYAELFQRADQALYLSKRKGKNTFSVYDSSDDSYSGLHIPETVNSRIESEENSGLLDTSVIRLAFKRLYEAKNEEEAINKILQMIGEQMNVDRVYIFEDSPDGQYCSNTFEWCHEGIEPQIDLLQNIHYDEDVTGFRESFNEQGIFYCPDIEKLEEPVYSVVRNQGIKSMLACAIREKGVFRGYIGFDECTEERIWTKEQIEVLTFFAEMLSVFLIKMRAQRRITQYAENLSSVLNGRSEYIYVMDAKTYEVRFVNRKAKTKFEGIEIGKRCFEAINDMDSQCRDCPINKEGFFSGMCGDVCYSHEGWIMHVEASLISWQGEPAYLIICRDKEEK